jgi:hypothetical protein
LFSRMSVCPYSFVSGAAAGFCLFILLTPICPNSCFLLSTLLAEAYPQYCL